MTIETISVVFDKVPSTTSTSTFDIDGDDFLGKIPPFRDQLNASIAGINLAVVNIDALIAGVADLEWVSGSSYTTGDVRWSPMDFLSYRRTTNGAGTTDPSIDGTNWVSAMMRVPTGLSNEQTSAVDITLTNNSPRLQVITMTELFKSVLLPVPISSLEGSDLFNFKNQGPNTLCLRDSDENLIARIDPGKSTSIGLTNAAANKWTSSLGHLPNPGLIEVINSSAITDHHVAQNPLTATKTIAVYDEAGQTYMVVLSKGANDRITSAGSPVIIPGATLGNASIESLSATQALIVYHTSGGARAKAVTITGTVPSLPGPEFTIDTVVLSLYKSNIVRMSSTKAVVSFGTTTSYELMGLSVTGNVVSGGAAVAPAPAGFLNPTMRAISATEILVGFGPDGNKNDVWAGIGTLSVTALSFPSGVTMFTKPSGSATSRRSFSIEILSDGTIVALTAGITGSQQIEVVIGKKSGTSILDIKSARLHGVAITSDDVNATLSTLINTDDQIIMQYQSDKTVSVATLEYNGFAVDVLESGSSQSLSGVLMGNIDDNEFIVMGSNADGYASAHVLEATGK